MLNKSAKAKPHKHMQVLLGHQTLMAYVAAPKKFNIIGVVRMDMEFGLLARTEAGTYVRVNGSQEQNLCQAQVESAIRFAISIGYVKPHEASQFSKMPGTPNVVVRKRRHIESPLGKLSPLWDGDELPHRPDARPVLRSVLGVAKLRASLVHATA